MYETQLELPFDYSQSDARSGVHASDGSELEVGELPEAMRGSIASDDRRDGEGCGD